MDLVAPGGGRRVDAALLVGGVGAPPVADALGRARRVAEVAAAVAVGGVAVQHRAPLPERAGGRRVPDDPLLEPLGLADAVAHGGEVGDRVAEDAVDAADGLVVGEHRAVDLHDPPAPRVDAARVEGDVGGSFVGGGLHRAGRVAEEAGAPAERLVLGEEGVRHPVGGGGAAVVDAAALEVGVAALAVGRRLGVAGGVPERAVDVVEPVVLGEDRAVHLVGPGRGGPVDVAALVLGPAAAAVGGGALGLDDLAEEARRPAELAVLLVDGGAAVGGEAGGAVVDGLVVGGAGGGAAGVVEPRWRARGDAAHDRAVARDLLVALAVPELVAAGAAPVARVPGAAARALRGAGGVAVDDVARRAAAVGGVVGLPPAGHEAVRRAGVGAAVDRAAEGGPAIRAGAAQVAVGGAGLEQEVDRADGERRAHHRGAGEERAATRAPAEERGGLVHDALAERGGGERVRRGGVAGDAEVGEVGHRGEILVAARVWLAWGSTRAAAE